MDTPDFFYVLFLVFFIAIGAMVFGAWVAKARAAKASAQAARARQAAARNRDAHPSRLEREVVQTDHSAHARNSDVVTQPSNRRKQVKIGARAGALTERSKLYWDFWEQFLDRVGTEHSGWTKRRTSTRASRFNLPTGTSAVAYSTAFTQHGLSVQLYFSSPDASLNSVRFDALRATKDEFERALGRAAEWDDKPGKKTAAICVTSQFGNVADVDLWPAMLDWALDQHVRFRQAVEAVDGLARLKEARPRVRYAEAG
ncbi:hypothetical protein A9W99_00450 [Mycobacterium sp. 1164966.3]|uniref:DUF4268 domain-containing protein n=1 Tax=Mycobacterium sp. 1164966.3 TaxID=1856861 RepID=UPI0007FE6705|nr:DUF4268 domain-containing protein [Mycobacterium sp. 1164966.3]OBA84385.1 hypothetical protein A9W99_00450 [Mycobacterium sp. 1164966.3]